MENCDDRSGKAPSAGPYGLVRCAVRELPRKAREDIWLGGALSKSDILIESPSNDSLTANAIARTMIELDASGPVSKHVALACWKDSDEAMERNILRTTRIDNRPWSNGGPVEIVAEYLTQSSPTNEFKHPVPVSRSAHP